MTFTVLSLTGCVPGDGVNNAQNPAGFSGGYGMAGLLLFQLLLAFSITILEYMKFTTLAGGMI